MLISDWSSDVCSSDLSQPFGQQEARVVVALRRRAFKPGRGFFDLRRRGRFFRQHATVTVLGFGVALPGCFPQPAMHASSFFVTPSPRHNKNAIWYCASTTPCSANGCIQLYRRHWRRGDCLVGRSEAHTSELQSLMRISYAVFCL